MALKTAQLEIPHPQIPQRLFVLLPLSEIATGLMHPILKKTVRQMLNECADTSIVRPHSGI